MPPVPVLGGIFFSAMVAAALGLLIHVHVQRWAAVRFARLSGQPDPRSATYSLRVNVMAYLTAVVSLCFVAGLYYATAAVWSFGSVFLDGLFFSALILEIKGRLIREPVMQYTVFCEQRLPRPLYGVVLQSVDGWLAGLALGFSVVLLCPVR